MRKWNWVCVFFWLMLCVSSVQAQIEIKTESATAISGLNDPAVVGDVVVFTGGELKLKSIGIIYVEAVGEVTVDATDEQRLPVEVKPIEGQPGVFVVEKPGKVWVDVSEYGEVELAGGARRRILLDRKTVVVVVSPDPTPPGPEPSPPGPGPGPSPDAPFEGLAGKVSRLAVSLTPANKAKLRQVFEEASARMKRGEFLQISQASNYITANRPPCSPGSGCADLYNFLAADARTRTLGWQAAQDYYLEVAKGLR